MELFDNMVLGFSVAISLSSLTACLIGVTLGTFIGVLPGIGALAAEGTAAVLDGGSPSASVVFAGVPCLLYRTAPQAARLHVESPFAAYIWTWLEGCVGPVRGLAANPSDNEGA